MREIALDTETTGLDPASGHRVVEIGCVEMYNHVSTGKTFHTHLNPERDMPEEARAVHGLDEAFLSDKPVFAEVVSGFLEFIGDAPLVIHNAEFDMRFINAELGRLGFPALPMSRTVDTVQMARRKFPGAQANLDALCRRFEIDNSNRTLHGALLDADLLSLVYLELCGGRQPGLELAADAVRKEEAEGPRDVRPPRPHAPSAEEEAAHEAFIGRLTDPVWRA
ncbi:MAG: DNA polymerase III subunit epsilon [Rhodospirillales bacterium]|nr:DNA polymerase III subunit epsilon [Rhodospirillales bacterium]